MNAEQQMRGKYLTEAMGGKKSEGCFCDLTDVDTPQGCVLDEDGCTKYDCSFAESGDTKETCGEWNEYIVGGVIDFSTWDGFGKLWTWAQEQKWWGHQFKSEYWGMLDTHAEFMPDQSINPDKFATIIFTFLKGREA